MALIKCPECGKDVSDKAPACIHCGFPLSQSTHIESPTYFGVKVISDTWVMGKARTFLSRAWVINKSSTGISDLNIIASGISKDRAELLLDYLVSHGGSGELFEDTNCMKENTEMTRYIDTNINAKAPVMCPRCGSREVVTGQRGYSLLSGFIGSGKTVNRCGKCGYSWQP